MVAVIAIVNLDSAQFMGRRNGEAITALAAAVVIPLGVIIRLLNLACFCVFSFHFIAFQLGSV